MLCATVMSPVRAASWRDSSVLTACNFTSLFTDFFQHFVDFQLERRDSLRVPHLAESDFSPGAMQLAKKRRNLLVGRTPACNNTLREPQSSTSLGSKVRRMRKMRFYRELGSKKIALVLWGVCRRMSIARGGIYYTISICAIVVPLL